VSAADFAASSRLQIISADGQQPIHISTSVSAGTAFYISTASRVGIGTSSAMMRLHVATGAVCIGSESYCENLTDSEGFLYATTIVADAIFTDGMISEGSIQINTLNAVKIIVDEMVSEGSIQVSTLTAVKITADEIVSAGSVSGTTFIATGGDYAEYFPAEENLPAGTLVGLNLQTGLVRSYRAGDPLIGVVSDRPGILGNNIGFDTPALPVAVLGQVPVIDTGAKKGQDGRVFTGDGLFVGYRLSDGRVWLRPEGNRTQLEALRQEVKYLQKEVKRLADIIEKSGK
jgi:hypothetical protein